MIKTGQTKFKKFRRVVCFDSLKDFNTDTTCGTGFQEVSVTSEKPWYLFISTDPP